MFGQIQPLTSADLPGCLALAQDRDWLPEERKWRLLFDLAVVYGVVEQQPPRALLGQPAPVLGQHETAGKVSRGQRLDLAEHALIVTRGRSRPPPNYPARNVRLPTGQMAVRPPSAASTAPVI